jgi:hypothetical protein
LRLLLEGKYRILLDRAGTLTERRLAEAYRLRAEIQLAQGNLPDALASVKASESSSATAPPRAICWRAASGPRFPTGAARTPRN